MSFSWEHLFNLTKKFLGINQAQIAKALFVTPSAISKIKSGKHIQPSAENKDIYKKLFDPDTSKIHEYLGTKDTTVLLKELKDTIKDIGLEDMTQDVEGDTYKEFIMGLLNLARNNASIASSKKKDVIEKTSPAALSEPTNTNNISPPAGVQLHISCKYKKCLFCMNWKGNANFASESVSGTFGKCIVFNDKRLSTYDASCEYFCPNYSRITSSELSEKSGCLPE